MSKKTYDYNEAYAACVEYFNGSEIAASVFLDKYALRNNDGEILEKIPDQMHRRIAKEFARIERKKFKNPISEDEIFNLLDRFSCIIPQGSPMYGIGNENQLVSLSNCFKAGTKVFTINGVKKIEDVVIGDEIITHNGNIEKVSQTHKNPINGRKVYKVKCYRSPEFEVTENHRFLSISKEQIEWEKNPSWNDFSYLRKGDFIAIPQRHDDGIEDYDLDISKLMEKSFEKFGNRMDLSESLNEQRINLTTYFEKSKKDHNPVKKIWKINKDFSYFIGLWYGDGCVFNDKKKSLGIRDLCSQKESKIRGITFTFSSKEKDLIKFVSSYGSELFGLKPDVNDNTKIDGTTQIVFHSMLVGIVFEKLFGSRCDGKKMFSDAYRWSENLVIQLTKGLVDSDGTFTKNGDLRVVLKNNDLIESFYHILRSHGHLVGISTSKSYSRLDFPKGWDGIDISKKVYSDDRVEVFIDSKENSLKTFSLEGYKFVRIDCKENIEKTDDYYYTLGIENEDHSYSIEGLICENCFVIPSVVDSYGGICKYDELLVQISKRRGGVGGDVANLRPEGARTKNAARTSTGKITFMSRFSNSIREVGQNGRRGAKMITTSIHHPEAVKVWDTEERGEPYEVEVKGHKDYGSFKISSKHYDPENLDFATCKYDSSKVTGANISIRLTDEFLTALDNNEKFQQRWPVDKEEFEQRKSEGKYVSEKWVDAKSAWEKVIYGAWRTAEPGVLFWDNILKESPADCYSKFGFRTLSTNPCVVGETLIAVADGRNAVSIKDLVEEGKSVPVYSTNPKTGQVEIKMGRNPRKTGFKKEVWKLVLDDDSELIMTPNHKILTLDLKYVELKNLKEGDSIYPFYSFNSNGYRQISNTGQKMFGGARRNRRQYRLINEFYNGDVDAKKFAIHHKDFDSLNDNINNLQIILHEEHNKIHADKMMGTNNPYHRMNDEWKFNFASHPGESNPKFSGKTNKDILYFGKKVFNKYGKITKKIWIKEASKNGYPQFLGNDFRFGSFTNFKNQVSANHKVKKIEKYGYEDVYNITVDDNHNYHVITSNKDERYVTSSGICIKNCGEIPLSAYDSCRLMVLNLFHFVKNPWTKDAYFDFEDFFEKSKILQRLMDDLIDLEIESIEAIIEKIKNDPEEEDIKRREIDLWTNVLEVCKKGRRTGCGITALGDTVAALNFKYGSEDSIDLIDSIYKTLKFGCYTSSIDMSEELGSFPVWDHELEKDNPFINRIKDEVIHLGEKVIYGKDLCEKMKRVGRRNIALLTTAPTGSISLLAKLLFYFGTSSGIEPQYTDEPYTRKKKGNPGDENFRVDSVDQNGDSWMHFQIYSPAIKDWMESTGETDWKKSPFKNCTAIDLDWKQRVKLQATAQRHIDHSISSTVNLPNDVTVEKVMEIYETAAKLGCKGITVYRDGCRTGVLVKDSEKEDEDKISKTSAPKRPNALSCEVHHTTIKGHRYYVVVGLFKGEPYEVFVNSNHDNEGEIVIPKSIQSGIITKEKRGKYVIEVDDKSYVLTNGHSDPNADTIARLASTGLRHGVDISFIVHQLEKTKGGDMNSFSKVLARVLKKYIVDSDVFGASCPNCQTDSLVWQDGCKTCKTCGYSGCT